MTERAISPGARSLSEEEVDQYKEQGYVKNLSVFSPKSVPELQSRFMDLLDGIPDNVDICRVNNWHKANRWIYELSRSPAILDYVEAVQGPDFHLWAGTMFIKRPRDGKVVPFHKDAGYWPLEPRVNVTAWLAVFDTDSENGCMRFVPGSHRQGAIAHEDLPDSPDWSKTSAAEQANGKYVLWQQVAPNSFTDDQVMDMDLRAGEMSLHDDDLIHGSNSNGSDRMRAGIVFRYIPTEVKCDLTVWPTFEVYPCRGTDRFDHNPVGKVPVRYSYPTTFNQHSREFE